MPRNSSGALGPMAGSTQKLTIDATTAQALTVPANAQVAIVSVETQAARFRDDGTDPTSTTGQPMAVGGAWTFEGNAELKALKFIGQTASTVLTVSYYG